MSHKRSSHSHGGGGGVSLNEGTPLLPKDDHATAGASPASSTPPSTNPPPHQQQHHQQRQQGQASVTETVLNQMKTCMGTGTLALSYSCQQSGLVAFGVGMVAIAVWNVYCTGRLVNCLQYLPEQHEGELRKTIDSNLEGTFVECSNDPAQEEDGGRGADDEALESDGVMGLPPRYSSLSPSTSPALPSMLLPPPGTSQLGQVAFAAYGNPGLQVLDLLVVLLLHGIIVSYLCAAVSFLNDAAVVSTVIHFLLEDPTRADQAAILEWSTAINAAVSATLMWTMSLVPDMGHLSRASAIGLSVLLATFVVIAGYGLVNAATTNASLSARIPMFPASPVGLARWFGVVAFSMGTVPLTYNFRQSMRQPQLVMKSTKVALASVALLYLAMGIGLLWLFPDLTGDVLHELPIIPLAERNSESSSTWIGHAIIPLLARLAMVSVVIMTAPLLVVPCGELVEGKLFHHYQQQMRQQQTRQPPMYEPPQQNLHHHHHHRYWIAITRACICGLCAVIATAFPSFVQVLSVVGSACVGTVSFVLPPLFHSRLVVVARARATKMGEEHCDAAMTKIVGAQPGMDQHKDTRLGPVAGRVSVLVDLCMIAIGVTATVLATVLSVRG